MKSRRIFVMLSTLCAMILSNAVMTTGVSAQADNKVSIMVGGLSKQIYLPAKLTEQLGYFKDEGLDVSLLDEGAGVDATDEMLAGRVDGVVGFYDHTIALQGLGKLAEVVVQLDWVPGEVELVSSKEADTIKSPADFKGKNLGVTDIGSSTDFLTQYMAVKAGLQISDIHRIGVQAGDTFIAAMKQGKIDAGMTTEPTISRELSSGDAKILVDMRTAEGARAVLGGTYPAASVYMQADWVNAHKDLVQKVANAFVKTMRWIHSHSASEIADKMPVDYYVGNKDQYVQALIGGMGMYTPDGEMPLDGPPVCLAVLSTFNKDVQGKKIDLTMTYNMEFVDKANAALGPLPTAAATEGAPNYAPGAMAPTMAATAQ
ncbi:MAG TPA: ABC transporter substrate-binding protein [Aggregatilineales bacterium]|nr:ABC transporter substrate-binding protein [Aggregatilineales bacterium]